jgi:DNA-binding NtrC family response regulator
MYCVLGSPKARKANVRIIASTNLDLNRKIHDGSFREDLFYRLAVLILNLPPLRERSSDIPLLANHFCRMYASEEGHSGLTLSGAALEALKLHSWPGNVRELENAMHRVLVLTDAYVIEPEDLPLSVPARSYVTSHKEAKARAIEQFERNYIAELLRKHNGNVTQAAREAKQDRRAMGRLIKKYRLPKSGTFLTQGWDKT